MSGVKIMLIRCILLLTLSAFSKAKRVKDIFDLSADDIIASEIGDLYEARALLNNLVDETNDTTSTVEPIAKLNNTNKIKSNKTEVLKLNSTTTTEKVAMASIAPEIEAKYINITLRDLKRRRLKRQLEKVLNTDLQPVSNYLIGADDPKVLTRRFDELVAKFKKNNLETRREIYDLFDNQPRTWQAKKTLLDLMEHFIYETRYKLAFAQVLRKKYMGNHRYKLGFLFALLRHLKNMQKWVFWGFKSYHIELTTIYFTFKMFEKITRLDVDIKDVISLIRKTEYQKNVWYSPKFYDYSLEKR